MQVITTNGISIDKISNGYIVRFTIKETVGYTHQSKYLQTKGDVWSFIQDLLLHEVEGF